MTPTARAALIARLTHAAETVGERVVDVARADLRAALALVRELAEARDRALGDGVALGEKAQRLSREGSYHEDCARAYARTAKEYEPPWPHESTAALAEAEHKRSMAAAEEHRAMAAAAYREASAIRALALLPPVASVEGYHCRYDEVPCKRCEARIIAENEARRG